MAQYSWLPEPAHIFFCIPALLEDGNGCTQSLNHKGTSCLRHRDKMKPVHAIFPLTATSWCDPLTADIVLSHSPSLLQGCPGVTSTSTCLEPSGFPIRAGGLSRGHSNPHPHRKPCLTITCYTMTTWPCQIYSYLPCA